MSARATDLVVGLVAGLLLGLAVGALHPDRSAARLELALERVDSLERDCAGMCELPGVAGHSR